MKNEITEYQSSLYTQTEDPTCLSKTDIGTNVTDEAQKAVSLDITPECRRNYTRFWTGMENSAATQVYLEPKMAAIQLCAQNIFALQNVCEISDSEVDTGGNKMMLHSF